MQQDDFDGDVHMGHTDTHTRTQLRSPHATSHPGVCAMFAACCTCVCLWAVCAVDGSEMILAAETPETQSDYTPYSDPRLANSFQRGIRIRGVVVMHAAVQCGSWVLCVHACVGVFDALSVCVYSGSPIAPTPCTVVPSSHPLPFNHDNNPNQLSPRSEPVARSMCCVHTRAISLSVC